MGTRKIYCLGVLALALAACGENLSSGTGGKTDTGSGEGPRDASADSGGGGDIRDAAPGSGGSTGGSGGSTGGSGGSAGGSGGSTGGSGGSAGGSGGSAGGSGGSAGGSGGSAGGSGGSAGGSGGSAGGSGGSAGGSGGESADAGPAPDAAVGPGTPSRVQGHLVWVSGTSVGGGRRISLSGVQAARAAGADHHIRGRLVP